MRVMIKPQEEDFNARICSDYISRVGVFATLTNSYALVALGASENFYR